MFKFAHTNFHVSDLERSLKFYKEALNLTEKNRRDCGDFILVYLGDKYNSQHRLELKYFKDRKEPYNLGDNKTHLAFTTKNFSTAHELHEKMNCIVTENKAMRIYFIADPDGNNIEILPEDDDF